MDERRAKLRRLLEMYRQVDTPTEDAIDAIMAIFEPETVPVISVVDLQRLARRS